MMNPFDKMKEPTPTIGHRPHKMTEPWKQPENLTKENFWNDLMVKYPIGMKIFCDWIDGYKKLVNWDLLFCNSYLKARNLSQTKYHDLPFAMQIGIWIQFVCERGGCQWEIENLYTLDWRKDIEGYIQMLHETNEES